MTTPLEKLAIFQAPNGAIELRADSDAETVWANQKQIGDIFGIERSVVTKHINNLFKDKEIDAKRNVQNLHIANSDKPVKFYSLDVILAVGYRTKSSLAIKFRIRATQTLKLHITQGFTINRAQIVSNYEAFLQAVESVKALAHDKGIGSDEILELIKAFSQTWFSLDAFDKGGLDLQLPSAQTIKVHANELYEDILILKRELIERDEASDLFALEKQVGYLEGIFGNIFQSAGGKDVYPSISSKAGHLLYFIIKDHPFVDGNKRTGAFAFIWFLKKTLSELPNTITPATLTTLTLLIATSDPRDKDRIIGLVLLLLRS